MQPTLEKMQIGKQTIWSMVMNILLNKAIQIETFPWSQNFQNISLVQMEKLEVI